MNRNRLAFVLGFTIVMTFFTVAWAVTFDQIMQRVYDPVNRALRLHQVAG